MRGKLFFAPKRVDTHRITPADAGKTVRTMGWHGSRQDHPRGCGENSPTQKAMELGLGSPPRMRGKHRTCAGHHRGNGITPADAGKTEKTAHVCATVQDHPRGCGENFPNIKSYIPYRGSPPRMRGKRLLCEPFKAEARITPADAGKTTERHSNLYAVQDHPRGCGENGAYALAIRTPIGSPPRMRGKLSLIENLPTIIRITPADAGKTRYGSRVSCKPWDHPRGCGENSHFKPLTAMRTGSPPRMRGKPVCL